MKTIDADEIFKKAAELSRVYRRMYRQTKDAVWASRSDAVKNVMRMIYEAPTIDHRDLIVKGEWLECDYKTFEHGEIETHYGKGFYCSLCRCGFKKDELKYRNFCPSCGAKMDGDVNE